MHATHGQEYQYERIAQYIGQSDLQHKARKLDALRQAARRRIPMKLVETDDFAMILVDGIAIDTSELETGHWL